MDYRIKLDAGIAGPLFMISAALLFTAMNLIVKLLNPEFLVWHIGFFRFFGGMLIIFLVFGKKANPAKGMNIRLLVIRGCVGSVAFISLVTAIRFLPVSTALVLFYSYPAFSAVASYFIYGERLGWSEMVCIAIVMLGIALLFDMDLSGSMTGQIMAVVGGAFAGLTVTLIRSLRLNNGPVVIYLYFCIMGTLVTAPMFVSHPVFPETAMEWVMILGIVFTSLFAQLLMNQGFFYCRGWEGGVFMSSEVIFTAIIGIVFLGDPATWRFWTGGLLVLGSAVVLNRINAEKARKKNGLRS
jgi:drug/metabolite transporter (DMT)-like permease